MKSLFNRTTKLVTSDGHLGNSNASGYSRRKRTINRLSGEKIFRTRLPVDQNTMSSRRNLFTASPFKDDNVFAPIKSCLSSTIRHTFSLTKLVFLEETTRDQIKEEMDHGPILTNPKVTYRFTCVGGSRCIPSH